MAQFDVGKEYSGFMLVSERRIDEVNSIARIFLHTKSGARLFYLANDDDNKVFCISFRTPPNDSTGVPHIMEHSVLCGSRKFPTKEPFTDLMKGSLNTFLNAMTYPDKTMYPVASRNPKDFMNLMDVYMDAVLYPNIYKKPEILMQEGWHYELDSKDGEITYKGVVYNEMKGAFSSPEQVLFRKIQESLFPDTTYGVESGGDPEVIPRLTYEQFLAFHRRFYHPSNSYIFLYGDGDILEHLSFLDGEYLRHFDKADVDSHIELQGPFPSTRELIVEYPIAPKESPDEKAYLSLNWVVGSATDPEICLAFEILEYLLLETPAAPLKKALLDAHLGKDVFGSFEDQILQPVLSVVVKNSSESRRAEFEEVVYGTLRRLVDEGIDKKLVEAAINSREFRLREADYRGRPTGLFYCVKAMASWLYDESPVLHLEYEPLLASVKQALTTRYFENLIEKYLLNNPHSSAVIARPKKGLSEERDSAIKKELAEFKAKLSDRELDRIVDQTARLKEMQETPDSPEDLETIPLLSLSDIKVEAERLPIEELEESGIKVLAHKMFTNHIVYLNLLFDTRTVPQDLISYVSLLTRIMGRVSTEHLGYEDLSNEINIHTGGIGLVATVYTANSNDDEYIPKLLVKGKSLVEKLPKLFELVREIVAHTRYDDRKRLKEIIQETKSRMEMVILEQGHSIAVTRVNSYFSPSGMYSELLEGISFYKFIAELESQFDSRFEEITVNLQKVASLIFNEHNLLVSVTISDEDYGRFREQVGLLKDALGQQKAEFINYRFDLERRNEGLMTPSNVQYVAKAYNYRKLGYDYRGSLQVLQTIVGYDYLWNKVRVQGGAYGAYARFSRNGTMYFASYRDPNLKETLAAYDSMAEYVRTFDASEREMTRYVIGTFSRIDSPLTPSMKGERATAYYLTGLTYDQIQRDREAVIATKPSDIRDLAGMIRDSMKQGCLCVLGNEARLRASEDVFGSLVDVFE